MKFLKFWTSLAAVLLGCLLLLPACSGGKDKKDADKTSAIASTPGIKKRFNQLNGSLKSLEDGLEIQRKQIASAKAELEALRETLGQSKLSEIGADEFATTSVVVAQSGNKIAKRNKEAAQDKEKASDRVFKTLFIVLFLLFASVYLTKLWRDREYAPTTAPEYSAGGSDHYYSREGDTPPTDTASTPPLG
jgi:multidrug resistance efflux pump